MWGVGGVLLKLHLILDMYLQTIGPSVCFEFLQVLAVGTSPEDMYVNICVLLRSYFSYGVKEVTSAGEIWLLMQALVCNLGDDDPGKYARGRLKHCS